jgi:hypothetical protein
MPLVYTPSGSTTELVIIASIQNIARVVNSATGAIVASKTLDAPYLSSDSNCNDSATVRIIGAYIIGKIYSDIYLLSLLVRVRAVELL